MDIRMDVSICIDVCIVKYDIEIIVDKFTLFTNFKFKNDTRN